MCEQCDVVVDISSKMSTSDNRTVMIGGKIIAAMQSLEEIDEANMVNEGKRLAHELYKELGGVEAVPSIAEAIKLTIDALHVMANKATIGLVSILKASAEAGDAEVVHMNVQMQPKHQTPPSPRRGFNGPPSMN